jgi:hypothetical protein
MCECYMHMIAYMLVNDSIANILSHGWDSEVVPWSEVCGSGPGWFSSNSLAQSFDRTRLHKKFHEHFTAWINPIPKK